MGRFSYKTFWVQTEKKSCKQFLAWGLYKKECKLYLNERKKKKDV